MPQYNEDVTFTVAGKNIGSGAARPNITVGTVDATSQTVSGASTLGATTVTTLTTSAAETLGDTLVLSATRGINYGAGTVLSHFGGGTTAVTTLDASGKATVYNGISLVGNGFPYQVAKVDSTSNGANIASTLLYAVPASGGGLYRVFGYMVLTTKDAVSSTFPSLNFGWTDNETSVSTTSGVSTTSSTNAVGDHTYGIAIVNVKASTNITYSTSGYVSNTPGVMLYSVHLRLEAL